MCQSFAASESAPLTHSTDKWHHSYTPTRTAHAFATHPLKEVPTPFEHAIVPFSLRMEWWASLWDDVWPTYAGSRLWPSSSHYLDLQCVIMLFYVYM